MIPDDEVAKVLEMVRDGTITPDQGAELISAIKDSEHRTEERRPRPEGGRTLDEMIEEAVESAVSGSLGWVNRFMGEAARGAAEGDAWHRYSSGSHGDRSLMTLLHRPLARPVHGLELDVDVASASVSFAAHAGSDIVVRYAGPAQETPRVEMTDNRLEIERPSRVHLFGGRRGWEGPLIEVEVPQEVSLTGSVELGNGRLDIRRLSMEGLSAESGNGSVTISSARRVRDTSIETRNGTVLVAAEEIEELSIEALNGKVDVAGIIRATDIETTNGRIFVQPLPGSRGHLSAEASRGSILVRLPRDLGFALDAESALGTVQVKVRDLQRGSAGFANELHVSRGDSALKLDLEAAAGTITVEEAAG